jgi:hypothetical protein
MKFYDAKRGIATVKTQLSPSRGLGDTIAKVTKAIGMKPCSGCSKRQRKLNSLLPYNKSN